VIRHGYHDKDAQELFDQVSLKALTYGSGFIRGCWDPDAGDTFEFNEDSAELTMQGDIKTYSPSIWDMFLAPDCKMWRDMPWLFERIEMSMEEAKFKWQADVESIERFVKTNPANESELNDGWRERDDVVEVFLYTEKAAAINGMAGRECYCLEDGTLLGKPSKNQNPGEVLGYCILTDVDVPDQVYGKTFVEYIFQLQDILNRLDSSFVSNIAAHNVVRMVLPEGAEIEDVGLSNSEWDYIKITGNSATAPYFINPPALMPDAQRLRENLISGIQELAGVNDSMMGKVEREMSGFSIQTAIDAGNQTRRRLFNKYTLCVRDFWRLYLSLAVKHWDVPRMILSLGKEKAFEAVDLKGADINGGFDIICEYGASLSLDPARRREEIMQLMPIFEKAGVPTKTILSFLRLNELDQLYDRMQLAADRQREVFDEMQATGDYVEPREMQDHAGRLDYAYYFLETAEYKYLDSGIQENIEKHIKARETFAVQAATKGQQGAQGGAPPPPESMPTDPAAGAPVAPTTVA